MRFSPALMLVLLVAPMCSAQDTNFASGPNYLITTADTRFLHPIATPSMSLDAPLPVIPSLPEIGGGIADQPCISNLDAGINPTCFLFITVTQKFPSSSWLVLLTLNRHPACTTQALQ
jgi:hypothetical protein